MRAKTHFVISDHLGYPEMVMDTTGAPVWTADHLPFGETVSGTGTPNDPLLRYPGQWAVPRAEELNLPTLYYNTYRWYRPQWGRYTQSDPLPVKSAHNLFLYGGANPLRFIDPVGLQEMPMPGPDFGSGKWGPRPNPDDCCTEDIKGSLDSVRGQLGRMMWGVTPIENPVAVDLSPIVPDPDRPGWWNPVPRDPGREWTPNIINPPKDPCVRYCAAVHEYYHYTDPRPWNEAWPDNAVVIFWERPAYRIQEQCLLTFLN